MATLLKTFSGTARYSPSNKYSVQAKALLYLDTNTGSGYTMHWVWQLYVPKWVRDVGWTLYMTTPSGNTSGKITYSSGATMTNTVLASKTGPQFTVAYGGSCSTTTTSYWTSDGGTKYESSLSAAQTTYTVPKPSYTISYNANGGSGAPSNQTKVYGTNITLSTIVPTREAYIFKGWSTSSTATTATYQPGGSFSTNANTVLYAVWSLIKTNSKITSMKLKRCLQDGTEDSEGTYCKITVNYAADVSQDSSNTIVRLKWLLSNDESGIININQAEGSTVIINQNELVLEENCSATVLITDEYTDDGTETFEEYSDLQKRMVYAPSLLKRPKLYIKNWYNTKVSEYGDSLIEFPDELNNALGSDKLYANIIQNDEEIFNNYTLNLTSDSIAESTFNNLVIEGQSEQSDTPTPSTPALIQSVESRNLLWDSSFNDVSNTWSAWGSPTTSETVTIENVNYQHILTGTSGWQGIQQSDSKRAGIGEITAGETFMFSIDAYSTTNISLNAHIYWYDSNHATLSYTPCTFNIDTTPKHYVYETALTAPTNAVAFNIAIGKRVSEVCEFWLARPMLERGTVAHSYQPHDCVTLMTRATQSRNLIDVADISDSVTNYYYDNIITSFKLTAGVTYTLSMDITSTVTPFKISVGYGNGTYTGDILNVDGYTNGRSSITFTPTETHVSNGAFLAFRAPRYITATTCNYTISNIQLELGTTATAYMPYVDSRTDIDLQGHALRSLPDGTHDEMYIDSLGHVTMIQRVGAITLNGSETWNKWGNYDLMYTHVESLNGVANASSMSTRFAYRGMYQYPVSDMADGQYLLNSDNNTTANGNISFMVEQTHASSTIESWTTWLAANPTTILYPLATPQTINLGTIELPTISENNIVLIDALVSPTINTSYNENIIYADELNDLFIYLYNAGEWNDNSNPLTGTSSAHIMDIAHSALSGFYFSVPDGTVIQRIEKLYTYNGGSFTDSVTNELWNITSEGNTVSDEILILQGGNA